jgi:hypothetical protein
MLHQPVFVCEQVHKSGIPEPMLSANFASNLHDLFISFKYMEFCQR